MTNFDHITPAWLSEKLKEYNLTQAQIAKDLNVDKFVISKLLSGGYSFTRWHKAAFYYYFESLKK